MKYTKYKDSVHLVVKMIENSYNAASLFADLEIGYF